MDLSAVYPTKDKKMLGVLTTLMTLLRNKARDEPTAYDVARLSLSMSKWLSTGVPQCSKEVVWFSDTKNGVSCDVHWFHACLRYKQWATQLIMRVTKSDKRVYGQLEKAHVHVQELLSLMDTHWTTLKKGAMREMRWFSYIVKGMMLCTKGRYEVKTTESKLRAMHTGCIILAEVLGHEKKARPACGWLRGVLGRPMKLYFNKQSRQRYVLGSLWAYKKAKFALMSGSWILASQLGYKPTDQTHIINKTHQQRINSGYLKVHHVLKQLPIEQE